VLRIEGFSGLIRTLDQIDKDSNQVAAADEQSMLPPASANAMDEYFQLQQNLLLCTLGFTAVIFGSVWLTYSLSVALNYLIGACTGVVYLRMLAKNVANHRAWAAES
jgi:Flp pilus assembly protein TadB